MRALLIATGIFGFVFMSSGSAAAQSASGMAIRTAEDFGIEVDPQITNASNALEEAVKTWVTSGESTRGATGAIGALIVDSDNLMCSAWMTSFYTAMTQMSTSAAASDAGTAVMQAMNRLRGLIEAACEKALKGSRTIGVIGGGEGGGVVDGPVEPVPNTCPDCPYEKNAVEMADYRLASAQYQAARAAARTGWAYDLAGTRPELYGQFFVSKPQELEREQEAAEAAVEKAQAALNRAKSAYDACIAACRKQAGFFDRNRKAVLATAAALVATTVFVAGGGGTPTTFVSTPPAQQPVATTPATPPQTTTPVVSAPPAPTPATLSLILGRWICAACRAMNDPDRHENTLRFCVQLIAAFQLLANSPLRIEHPAPWVTVTGELDEASGNYRATGMGSVSGFSNVSSTVTANFQRSGDTVTAVDLTVTLGENGVFPGGRPVTYSVRLTKTP